MPESKEYSWAWVTASRLLTDHECELIFAHLVAGNQSTATVLYDGVNTSGDVIVYLLSAAITSLSFSPPVPIHCRKGLYITKDAGATGILVMWRHL
jgi:hypothetical protein